MFKIKALDHLNIVVDDINDAANFYQSLFGAKKIRTFPHFKNKGFAKAAGFLEKPENLDVSMAYLKIPNVETRLELFCFHYPKGNSTIQFKKTNDIGGIRHTCFQVDDINLAFEHVSNHSGITMINLSPMYKPVKIDNITINQFIFASDKREKNVKEKQKNS